MTNIKIETVGEVNCESNLAKPPVCKLRLSVSFEYMSGTPRAGDALKAIPPLLMYLGRWSWLQSLDWTVTRQKKSELIRIVNKVVLLEGAKSIAFTAATQTITQACTEIFQKIAGDFVLQLRMESNPL